MRRMEGRLHVAEGSRLFWNVRVIGMGGSRQGSAASAHVIETGSVVVPSTPAVLTGEIDLRMHDALQRC